MCRGDSCRFPVLGGGSFQVGPSLLTNSSCFSNKGMVRIGGIRGVRNEVFDGSGIGSSGRNDDTMTGGDDHDFTDGDDCGLTGSGIGSSGRNGDKVTGGDVRNLGGSCDGGLTEVGIGSSGRNDDEATGGDTCGVTSLKGGMSHGRGMRSRDEGPTYRFTDGLDGGNGISSGVGDLFHGAGMIGVAALNGGDGVSDWDRSMLAGSGVSFIGTGGSYCSIDEYWRRCDPQGTKGSGGDATWGGSTGRLGGVGMNGGANGDGFTRGGDGTLGTTGGNAMTSLGSDDDGWMYCRMTGIGPT